MPDAIAKGDTVCSNLTGGEYEVIDVVGDIVLGRPLRESYDGNVWVTSVTLVKRAYDPELPIVALTDDEYRTIAELVNSAGYPELAAKIAPRANAPAVGEWFRSPSGIVYRVINVDDGHGTLGRVRFDGTAETILTVLNEWTKVEVTDA